MKLPFPKIKIINYCALAFAFPFLCMVGVMIVGGYTPFGNSSMLYSDMYHQYYPFFKAYRSALLSGDSILYTWSVGMGMDYLGLISYYLASPLNLLSILVPEGILLQYFSLLVPIKLGLSGLFFSLFLKKTFHKDDLSISLFGAFYGLCAWALGYQWNVMWLDTFALLPLVILGMTAILKERKFVLYTFTLFLAIAANYYIGLFVCIFIFLCFICFETCRWHSFKKFSVDLLLMAFFSILAIGMTAFLELPALAALQTTQSSVNQFPEGFRLNIASENTWKGLLTAMVEVAGNMNGGLEPTFKEGLPNLYCGVLCNIFSVLFLTSGKVKLRDKLCCILLLLFFNLSFIIRQLDYIWHGFHFTNMIPYRFSFLYSFVILYMAYRAWLLRHQFRLWQFITAVLSAIGLIFCHKDLSSTTLWGYNLGFTVLYFGGLLYGYLGRRISDQSNFSDKKQFVATYQLRKQISSYILFGFMAAELVATVVCFGIYFPGTAISNYPSGKKDAQSAISHMKQLEKDTLFYRAETTHSQTLNDGAINGYYGVSTFTSSANVKTTLFMKALGYGAKNTYNRYCFEESSPVSNLFLGLKYMIERDGLVEENRYFEDVYQSGNVHLLRNNAYLPLGFLTENTLADFSFSRITEPFLFQNELFTAASGIEEPVWDLLGFDTRYIYGADVTINSQSHDGRTKYTTAQDADGTLTYRYLSDKEGLLCIHVDLSKRNKLTVYKNDEKLYSETHSLPQMLSVCDVIPGDVIEIEFDCKKGENGSIDVSAAILNNEVFGIGYDILNASTLHLTHFKNTLVEGKISCNRDGLLYTSIPQNGNWNVYVDGKLAEIHLVGDAMIGVMLTQGEHTLSYQYENNAFQIGWKVSLVCAVLLHIPAVIVYNKRKYQGRYLK